jgi:hypothetical protein
VFRSLIDMPDDLHALTLTLVARRP